MMYLIDDNQRNQQQTIFKAEYLFDGSFDDILEKIYAIKVNEVATIKEKLQSAEAIFLHNTFEDQSIDGQFIKSSLRVRKMIEDDIVDEFHIPLVLFSYGMTEGTIYDYESEPFKIKAIRKDAFYENLKPFLVHYQNTGEIEFRILAYGKKYQAEMALRLSERLMQSLSGKDFNLNLLSIKDLEDYFQLTDSQMTFNSFLDFIEDNIRTIYEFKILIRTIDKSLLRYGRNIHH